MNDETALRYIFSRLAGAQNVALIAPTRSGKTKLLKQIGLRNVYSAWLPDTSHWVFDYFATTQLKAKNSPADFWQKVWQGFVDKSKGQAWQGLLKELVDNATTQPFLSDRLLRQLDKQQVRLVLLLDDLDHLADNPRLFTPDLLGPLRSLSSRHQSFSVILSSRRRLSDLNRQAAMAGSPPFNNFNEVLLSEFVEP